MIRIQASDVTRLNMLNVVEPFRPYIDGIEFTDHPMTMIKDGKWNTNKPFIIGTNQEELVIFKYFLPMNENVFRVSSLTSITVKFTRFLSLRDLLTSFDHVVLNRLFHGAKCSQIEVIHTP